MICWDPNQYLQFRNERTQPAIDLVARIALTSPKRIIDLGCGPGNSTAVAAQRWQDASVTGLDLSSNMIAKARLSKLPVEWIIGDIAAWQPEDQYDLLFSNAALHWLPDHETLIPRLLNSVATGGALAVQIPSRLTSLAHRLMHDVADDPRWRDRTGAVLDRFSETSPAFYYDLLQPITRHLDLWMTEYQHLLPAHQSIIDWLRATGLNPILKALDDDHERASFEALLLDRYREAFHHRVDGKILLPLPRIFFVAYR